MVQAFPDEPDRIVFVRPLPGDALIELVVRHRLGLHFVLAQSAPCISQSWGVQAFIRRGGDVTREASVASMQSECPE